MPSCWLGPSQATPGLAALVQGCLRNQLSGKVPAAVLCAICGPVANKAPVPLGAVEWQAA